MYHNYSLRSEQQQPTDRRLSSRTYHKPTASALIQFLRGYFAHQGIATEAVQYRSDSNSSPVTLVAALKHGNTSLGEETAEVHISLLQKVLPLAFTVKAQMLPNKQPGYSITVQLALKKDMPACFCTLESMEDVYAAYASVTAYLQGR